VSTERTLICVMPAASKASIDGSPKVLAARDDDIAGLVDRVGANVRAYAEVSMYGSRIRVPSG